MKKKLLAALLALCLIIPLLPRADSAGAVYFTGVNSKLLPLTRETMPVYVGGLLYLPFRSFSGVGVHGIPSYEDRTLYLYRGGADARSVDFYAATGKTVDQDGHEYEDVTARMINNTFYLPLDFVCAYFNITNYVIDCEPAPIVRLRNPEVSALNDNTLVGMNRERMYNEYNALTASDVSQSPDGTEPPVTAPPSYSDVTVYLSFYGLSLGFAGDVLDILTPGYRCCFFVTAEDIRGDPGLVRRIASGHTLGIWLTEGTYDEYLIVSSLLFEAAKIKTVLVSSPADLPDAEAMAEEYGLAYWPVPRAYGDGTTAGDVKLPTAAGSRLSLLFPCSENTAALLLDVLAELRQGEYTVARITETAMA